MRVGQLELDPSKNPAILDTATWDPEAAWQLVSSLGELYWRSVQEAVSTGSRLPAARGFTPYTSSCATHAEGISFLASLADGQDVFVHIGPTNDTILGEPVGSRSLQAGSRLALYKADAATIDSFFRQLHPAKGPRALGAVPRLGIGTRMTTTMWPAIWQAVSEHGFAANAIQNSVRELYLLDDLLAGRPPERNYGFSFGVIESGYAGSTFEGLWTAGALAALKDDSYPSFGADADHIQVKRGASGRDHAKRLLTASRYYTFFTLDMSDVLDYQALSSSPSEAADLLADRIPDATQQRALVSYHRQKRRLGGDDHRPDEATIGRLVGKYWRALNALEELHAHIIHLRRDAPFDLELSIDEFPSGLAPFDCLTSDVELAFVLLEAQRRQMHLSHIAPNLGVQKGSDYACPDGLRGLGERTGRLSRIAADLGVMLDVHSGDDLGATTRSALRDATHGRLHFKISPCLQLLFAEVLAEHHEELFQRWWNDALAYAEREAASGSSLAAECLRRYAASADQTPSAHHDIFHHYGFAFVGRRDERGQFLNREAFYSLSDSFYDAYQARLSRYLGCLAQELFRS